MKQIEKGSLLLWQFERLGDTPGLQHVVSDRSAAPGENEFTLSLSSTPDKEAVHNNRSRLAAAMGIEPKALFFPSQVHGTRIVEVNRHTPKEKLADTDALITSEKGVCIAVLAADCVPILLHDRRNGVVAAVHSGWRGTAARILEKTLHEMALRYGSRGEDMMAAIGPSVCQDAYEVGQEVISAFEEAFGSSSGLMIPQPNHKARLDLWKANQLQLLQFGVPATQIEIASLCTLKHNRHFFSARGGDAGRFAAGIMLI